MVEEARATIDVYMDEHMLVVEREATAEATTTETTPMIVESPGQIYEGRAPPEERLQTEAEERRAQKGAGESEATNNP